MFLQIINMANSKQIFVAFFCFCVVSKSNVHGNLQSIFNTGFGLIGNLKQEIFMDSKLDDRCGQTFTGNEALNGFIYSHTGKASSAFGLEFTKYSDKTDCEVQIDINEKGLEWRILVQFLSPVNLAGAPDSCDGLYIYDGGDTDAHPLYDFCGGPIVLPPPVESSGTSIRVRMQTHTDSQIGDGFRLLYSAYRRDDTCGEDEFRCDGNRCVPAVFKCDGVHQCIDRTDETKDLAECSKLDLLIGELLGLGFYTMLTLVCAAVLVLLIVFITTCYCCCKRRERRRSRRRQRRYQA